MESSDLPRHLTDLWKIQSVERDKAVKLVTKIFSKILADPLQQTFGDLNFEKLCTKFQHCRPCFYLLYEAGFKQSMDGKRLQWIYSNDNYILLDKVNKALRQKTKEPNIPKSKFTTFLSIFKTHHHDIGCNGSEYNKCLSMLRLIKALQYRSLFKIMRNKDDGEIFRDFMNDIYPNFLNDYHHFQDYHCNELEKIQKDLIQNNQFSKCSMKHCQYTARHHRTETDENDNKDIITLDPHSMFYVEVMDSFHFQMFHSLDAGLRSKESNNNENDDDKEKFDQEKSDEYFDEAFARLHQRILSANRLTASFHRFSPKNTKFTISMEGKTNDKESKDKKMYLDQVIKHLIIVNVDVNDIKELRDYLKNEDYDSVSMKYDEGLNENGNIAKNIKNEICFNEYIAIIRNTKLSSSSFAIGIRTYYWKFYKDIEKLGIEEQFHGSNINDHSGYKVKELYVEAKYSSLKEEIANYKYIDLKHYGEVVLVKVNKLIQSDKVKRTTATGNDFIKFLHYDIKKGDPISMGHLLSLVLYTDYSDHCSHFSSTFRPKDAFELLKSMIKRNSEYYWMSRYLRECVEIFGQSRHDEFCDKRYGRKICLKGPFYTGMNVVMYMPSFNLRLCSPTSTSKQIEVAMKFSGPDGIVLQLNNPDTSQYTYLHGFNASWISRYPEEDERLFFGGFWFIQIESIRIRSTKQNFELFVHSLYCLDVMITGGQCLSLEINKDDVFIIQSLFENILNKNKNKETIKSIDDYIYSTFAAFTLNKKHITLNCWLLESAGELHAFKMKDSCDESFRDLFMYSLDERPQTKEKQRKDIDFRNLFKPQIFEIFSNIQSIIIQTTDELGCDTYSLSMVALLSLIERGSVQEVIVEAVNDMDTDINWINNVWRSSSQLLTKLYQKKNYAICIKQGKFLSEISGYWFEINRLS